MLNEKPNNNMFCLITINRYAIFLINVNIIFTLY